MFIRTFIHRLSHRDDVVLTILINKENNTKVVTIINSDAKDDAATQIKYREPFNGGRGHDKNGMNKEKEG